MSLKFKLIYISLIAVCLYSCSNNSENSISPSTNYSERNFRYPLTVNSFWYYGTRNFIFNLRPDSISKYFSTDTIPGYGSAIFEKDTIINSDTLVQLRNVQSTAGHAFGTTELYKETDTGLIRVAYYSEGTNFGPFRHTYNLSYSRNGNTFSSINSLIDYFVNDTHGSDTSLYFDDPPAKVLQYPITENAEWNSKNYGTTRIFKKYLNYENVSVTAGTFFCIKIKRDVYYNSNTPDTGYYFYDYFSEKGMVKRDLLIKDVSVSNEFGQTIGKIDVKEETFLNLYNIP